MCAASLTDLVVDAEHGIYLLIVLLDCARWGVNASQEMSSELGR
jgi:hypothetical protein